MLRTRLITAAILVPLVVYGVLNLPTSVFALILGAVLVAGSWERTRLVPLERQMARLLYCAVLALLFWLIWLAGPVRLIIPLLVAACSWWLFALYWVSHPQLCNSRAVACIVLKLLAGMLVCVPAWTALVVLHLRGADGPLLTLMLLVMVWLADTGAYFTGRLWGRHKLAPLVSPGKTREGVYGGLAVSLLFAGGAGWYLSHSLAWTATFAAVSLLAMLFSVVGDLLESLMKRQSGIKDSGHIIPGHGGIFDRVDSLVAAAPVFLSGFLWLEL